MRFVWQFLAVFAVFAFGGMAVAAVQDNPWTTLGLGLLVSAIGVLIYGWVVRRTEKRPTTEVGRKGAVASTSWGTLIGIGLFVMVILNIAFLGGYHVHGMGSAPSAVGLVGFMAAAAVTEELLFRGVVQRILEERVGTWISLAFTSVVSGAMHLLNPNASLWGAVVIALTAGTMLGAAYIATRKLWLPIGIHFGWNFAASGIFSTEVSGNGTPQSILDASTSGPVLLSGGDFGPEASLYTLVFALVRTGVFLWIAHRRGHLVPRGRRVQQVEATATLPH
ncbi:type II CAAX endopeptidase family protein [Glycomyces salinus]|uniref:type II CAAX endopeptidase family protein n=1 Tax=Glycomyces salinus TaxID=980294 RepID=UPI0018EC02F5|nr:type II CAAX endopeptidase family protein [Glycomyces salinus]